MYIFFKYYFLEKEAQLLKNERQNIKVKINNIDAEVVKLSFETDPCTFLFRNDCSKSAIHWSKE